MKTNIVRSLYFVFFFLPIILYGQDPFYVNYDTNDGLPSSETYYATEDANGLIWITTDRGVCTFDGYKFSSYTTKEGLSHNTNFRIFRDPKDRLWFTAWDGSLSVYDDGVFKEIPLYRSKIYNENKGYVTQLWFDKQDNIYFSNTRSQLFNLDANDFTLRQQSDFDLRESIWKNEEGNLLSKIGDRYLFHDNKYGFSVNAVIIDTVSFECLLSFNNSKAKLVTKNTTDYTISDLETDVYNFFIDKKNNLWLCTPDGLLLYEDANLELPPQHFFKGLEVTSILMDREGGYWMTSREKGIFWIPSFDIRSLLHSKQEFGIQRVLSIGKLSNYLLFGTVENGIVGLNQQFDFLPESENWRGIRETKRMYSLRNRIYLRDFLWIKEVNGKLKTSSIDGSIHNTSLVKELKNGYFLTNHISTEGYTVYSSNKSDLIFSTFEKNGIIPLNKRINASTLNMRINCLEEANNNYWLGGIDGLFHLNSEELLTKIPKKDTSELLDVRIEDIICIDSQKLWIATIGNGLIFKDGKKHLQLLQKDGLSSNLINRICLENDSTLWAGTNKGLDKILFGHDENGICIQTVTNYSTSDGLISNFINDLTFWKDQLWLATNKGINYFRPEKFIENKIPPLIQIKEVLVNGKLIKDQIDVELKHSENDLAFNYLGISFKKPKNKSFYRYRLKNKSDQSNWYYTDNTSVRFSDLAPGKYTFEVTAQNKNDFWSDQSAIYSFTINAHFTDMLWFKTLVVLSLIMLLGLGFFNHTRKIRNKEEQKSKLQTAELNVLRHQMNPHFIFNSLNSIQSFIFHQNAKKANYYLSKFSRLIRNSLEYSKLESITIHEEINFIRSYLDLEKLRFDDRFEVEIEVDPELEIHHCFIPPLLLQPIIENSVKHAFKNISYKGQLNIQFLKIQDKEMIHIIIGDNGIGLKENSGKTEKKAHRSIGLSIIKNRIKMLNPKGQKNKASFKFSNRYNAEKEIVGTEAHFFIPIQ